MFKHNNILLPILGLLPFLITNPAAAGVYDSVTNAKNAVQGTQTSAFKSADLQTACLHDIDGVNTTLTIAEAETEIAARNQLYQDALATVNSLASKTDGCSNNNAPDTDDWITDCNDSSLVYAALNQLVEDIAVLIQ